MINWYEMEEWAERVFGLRELTPAERNRMEALAAAEAARKPIRARIAASLVRIGARLDPKNVIIEQASDDALFEGRMAAYLR